MEITRIGRHPGKRNGIGWEVIRWVVCGGWEKVGGQPLAFAFYETISKCETNSHKILSARL